MKDGPSTVDELVEMLGGTGAVGRLLGIGSSAVSNWRAEGEIPKAWHLQLYLEAQRRNFRLPVRLFGVDSETAA